MPEIKSLKLLPHQLGWLRRPELDKEDYEIWELPDGGLHAHRKDLGQGLVLEKVWIDK